MRTELINELRRSSSELRQMADEGNMARMLENKAGHSICRLGDETIELYEQTADAIDKLTKRYAPGDRQMTHASPEPPDYASYVSYIADDAGSFRRPAGLPCDEPTELDVLVGWQCGFEPLFVRVRSYLGVEIDNDEAVELATDGLNEIGWFGAEGPREPDYIIRNNRNLTPGG